MNSSTIAPSIDQTISKVKLVVIIGLPDVCGTSVAVLSTRGNPRTPASQLPKYAPMRPTTIDAINPPGLNPTIISAITPQSPAIIRKIISSSSVISYLLPQQYQC